ncbi:hypothetical protein L198_06996 [Cryptococcus wingfieldii CBS 7118]|uniref:Uncharacterized protein n=1 Tax=Cryptococcus wingfieldii CBS 7118 TaxID=1295528 RepID=A0A1E3IFH8_9TREE|nr:hypothetical protein L198_06996 [Cryptococcus wingfieldii CBS 7118]ODN87372.1 hypothetical protein L198_06996 [Cryptococcus wingfieldii CBS 7118]
MPGAIGQRPPTADDRDNVVSAFSDDSSVLSDASHHDRPTSSRHSLRAEAEDKSDSRDTPSVAGERTHFMGRGDDAAPEVQLPRLAAAANMNIDSPLISIVPDPVVTAGPSSLGNAQYPFDPSSYDDGIGSSEDEQPPVIALRSPGSLQLDTTTGRLYEPYTFRFSSEQTGNGHSDLHLRAPPQRSYQSHHDWIAEIERLGGVSREYLGPRMSLDDAIATYITPGHDDRQATLRQMITSSLEQSWQSGRRSFNFARDGDA